MYSQRQTGIRSTVEDMKTIYVDRIAGPSEQYGSDELATDCGRTEQSGSH